MGRYWTLLFLLGPALAQIKVAATTPILADLVREVGGNRVQVVSVVPPGTDPHTFEPTPEAAKTLAQSRILFANGLGLEPYLPKLQALLPKGAKVVLLGEGQPGVICTGTTQGAEEAKEEGHGEEHEHGPCDPHLWLDPSYAVRYAERIAQELALLDPAGKTQYQANLNRFRQEVAKREQAFQACGLKGKKVVVQHNAFRYFARRYGLVVVGALSQAGAQEVGSKSFLDLLEKAKKEGVKLVLAEPQFRGTALKALAEALGARIAVLYTDTLDQKVPTYLALLDHNLKALCP